MSYYVAVTGRQSFLFGAVNGKIMWQSPDCPWSARRLPVALFRRMMRARHVLFYEVALPGSPS